MRENEKRDSEKKTRRLAGRFGSYIFFAGILALIVWAVFYYMRGKIPQGLDQSRAVEIQSRDHIAVGAEHLVYNSNPPTGGWHYAQPAQTGIYDKEFTKFSSRRGNISYQSAFSQLGCITPATLNRHTNYMNMIGARFLSYSMPTTNDEDAERSYQSILTNTDRSLIEKEARLYVSSYLNQLIQKPFNIKPLSKPTQAYLRITAELMSNCRGIVLLQSATFKNDDGEDVKYYEVSDVQIEEPWRAVQQIMLLAQYLAFVVGKDEVTIEELSIIKEVVISSMPADRSQALRTIKEQGGTITAKQLSDSFDRSIKTSRRLLDELTALKVLEKIKGSGTIATDYTVNEQFKNILLLNTAEFLSSYSSGTKTRDGIPVLSGNKDHTSLKNSQIKNQLKACYACGSTKFWKTKDGATNCVVCHPPVSEANVAEQITITDEK